MRENFEYALVWLFLRVLGSLPRPLARAAGTALGVAAYTVMARLRRVGLQNLRIAFPEMNHRERRRIVFRLFIGFGRHLAEFCRFPGYTAENAQKVATYDGFENY